MTTLFVLFSSIFIESGEYDELPQILKMYSDILKDNYPSYLIKDLEGYFLTHEKASYELRDMLKQLPPGKKGESKENFEKFCSIILGMLNLDPSKRTSVEEALKEVLEISLDEFNSAKSDS